MSWSVQTSPGILFGFQGTNIGKGKKIPQEFFTFLLLMKESCCATDFSSNINKHILTHLYIASLPLFLYLGNPITSSLESTRVEDKKKTSERINRQNHDRKWKGNHIWSFRCLRFALWFSFYLSRRFVIWLKDKMMKWIHPSLYSPKVKKTSVAV